MDEIDRVILNRIQSDFPLTSRPFLEIGQGAGISEQEALDRIKRLKQKGIIRRVGAEFNSRKLGYASTLCAARVAEEEVPRFVELINSYPGVTHNYRRKHRYNIWFTFIADSKEKIGQYLKEIRDRSGVSDILDLPALRLFKLKVDLKI
jgi:DNA-binding Lrp family transcriptional regulator